MAKELSQEEFDSLMSNRVSNERFVITQSVKLSEFLKGLDNSEFYIGPSNYGGYYCKIGHVSIKFSKLSQEELIVSAMHSINGGVIPQNVYIDEVVDTEKKILFRQARIEPNELNCFIIKSNDHLSKNIKAYYHTFYRRFRTLGNPDYINILKNQPYSYSQTELDEAAKVLKEVLSINLPMVKEKLGRNRLTVVLAPRAKANQKDSYQQLRKAVSEWCIENSENGFEDGCQYIIRHTDTPTTHLQEEGEIYPGITKETCIISPEIEGKDILFIDDIYTPGVNIDEDALQAVLDNKPSSITFYSVAKTPKSIKQ